MGLDLISQSGWYTLMGVNLLMVAFISSAATTPYWVFGGYNCTNNTHSRVTLVTSPQHGWYVVPLPSVVPTPSTPPLHSR